MTNAEIAHRLRCLMDVYGDMGELQHLANELDPPKPEPGAAVWYWLDEDDGPHIGVVEENTARSWARTQWGGFADLDECRWEPARILGPRQVAVDIPPTSEWWSSWDYVDIQYVPRDRVRYPFGAVTLYTLTREEAGRMEAEDDS